VLIYKDQAFLQKRKEKKKEKKKELSFENINNNKNPILAP
jgi:hypothetical protein